MDINSENLSKLLKEIEEQFRRKIVDYKNTKDLHYIDPDDNLSKLSIHNNHLIFGRRGSGKTTLALATIQKNRADMVSVQDMQSIKGYDSDTIISRVVLKTLIDLKSQFIDKGYDDIIKQYQKQFRGIRGKWSFITKSRDANVQELYFKNIAFLKLLNSTIITFEKLKNMPITISYSYALQDTTATKEKRTSLKSINVKGNFTLKNKINSVYGPFFAKVDSIITAEGNYDRSHEQETSHNTQIEITSQNARECSRADLVENTKEVITFICNEFNCLKMKNVVLYLDDFYLIPLERQPFIVQYLHDVYKNCSNYSFCFNICSLPSRLRINKGKSVDLSFKDDFSNIKLDSDLSELNISKDYLLKILVSLNIELCITKQDIESLFSNDEVLLYSIIATGGVPRDFLLAFADLVRTARSDNKPNIAKEHVYSVVKNLREDKDSNIEDDSDINPELIRNAIKILNDEVIDGLKTNVILYPKSMTEKHDILLKNLVNLRYLHIIKESISSDIRKKEEFTAYLVDMSFYAVNRRMKAGFDFRKFWEKDNDSRLTQLRSAKIWNFPEELFV